MAFIELKQKPSKLLILLLTIHQITPKIISKFNRFNRRLKQCNSLQETLVSTMIEWN